MKTPKSQAILRLYTLLKAKGHIEKEPLVEELGIENITFNRYMADIKAYLAKYEPERVIVYSRRRHSYVLKKTTK